jgi:hypothetical protein
MSFWNRLVELLRDEFVDVKLSRVQAWREVWEKSAHKEDLKQWQK